MKNMKIACLNSTRSLSAGDIYLVGFIGDKCDGDLGNNCKCIIVGDCYGATNHGANGGNNVIFSPLVSMTTESQLVLKYLNTDQYSTIYDKRYKPDIVLDPSWYNICKDFGIDGFPSESKDYLNGIIPIISDPTTWRDSWLETTIKTLLQNDNDFKN
jgi:hypothetical protein